MKLFLVIIVYGNFFSCSLSFSWLESEKSVDQQVVQSWLISRDDLAKGLQQVYSPTERKLESSWDLTQKQRLGGKPRQEKLAALVNKPANEGMKNWQLPEMSSPPSSISSSTLALLFAVVVLSNMSSKTTSFSTGEMICHKSESKKWSDMMLNCLALRYNLGNRKL